MICYGFFILKIKITKQYETDIFPYGVKGRVVSTKKDHEKLGFKSKSKVVCVLKNDKLEVGVI